MGRNLDRLSFQSLAESPLGLPLECAFLSTRSSPVGLSYKIWLYVSGSLACAAVAMALGVSYHKVPQVVRRQRGSRKREVRSLQAEEACRDELVVT